MEYINKLKELENIELYLLVALVLVLIWFIVNTIRFYFGEKRKIKHLHRFAKEGEAMAQYHLAQRYNKGDMMKKNCQNAAFWSQKASFSGNKEAETLLRKIMKKKRC
jgi:TPR repeat protein